MIRRILKIEEQHEIENREIRDPKKWKLEKEEFMMLSFFSHFSPLFPLQYSILGVLMKVLAL